MSVPVEFDCNVVRIQESTKIVYLLGIDGSNQIFTYDIDCKPSVDLILLRFFFSLKTNTVLMISKHSGQYNCVVMKFWLEKDSPIPAVKYYVNQDKLMQSIDQEFKEKYAAIIIDNAINS